MFDAFGPGTGFGMGAMMGGVMQDLLRNAATYDDWARAALEVTTSAQASYRHHVVDADQPNLQALARDLDVVGRQAQQLAVIAEHREYGEREADLLRELDRLCLRFTNGAPKTEQTPEALIRAELPDLVAEIYDALDRDPAQG